MEKWGTWVVARRRGGAGVGTKNKFVKDFFFKKNSVYHIKVSDNKHKLFKKTEKIVRN